MSVITKKPKGLRKRALLRDDDDEQLEASTVIHPKPSEKASAIAFASAKCPMDDSFVHKAILEDIQEKNKRLKEISATAEAQYDTEFDRDRRAILEKALRVNKELKGTEDVYCGKNYYKAFIEKKDSTSGSAASQKFRAGPVRAAANLRVSCRFDYQPHVCKDYKETGSCGFGDSCIYLHDRGDYKMGWELDKEWEEKQGKLGSDPSQFHVSKEDVDDGKDMPSICFICHMFFTKPVVTKCKHYFCEKCAIQYHTKSPKCAVCSAPTQGIFHVAKDLVAKWEEKEKRLQLERKMMEAELDEDDDE